MHCNGRFVPEENMKKRASRKKNANQPEPDRESHERTSQTPDLDVESYNDDETFDADVATGSSKQWGLDSYGEDAMDEEDMQTTARPSRTFAQSQTQSHMKGSTANGKGKANRARATSTVSDLTRTAIKNAAKSHSPEPVGVIGPGRLRGGDALTDDGEEEEEDIDEQIEKIKRCLKAFRMVYGDDLPDPDYSKYDIEHVSSTTKLPRMVPKSGFRTQGHNPLQYATVPKGSPALTNHMVEVSHNQTQPHDTRVLTEDPHFGSYPFDRSQIYSPGERNMLLAQNDRKELRAARASEDDTDMRAEAAEEHELERQLVLQQLRKPIFSWETEWTMAGVLTDETGMPNGNFWRVREDNERWKRLAERQAILAAGGEEAARIRMEDFEAAREEEKKEQRREERQRQVARKRARAMGIEFDDTGLSGWSAEV